MKGDYIKLSIEKGRLKKKGSRNEFEDGNFLIFPSLTDKPSLVRKCNKPSFVIFGQTMVYFSKYNLKHAFATN